MPSAFTTRNRLEKQGSGENTNSWGTILNNRVFDMVDALADGIASYALSGTKILTSLDGLADEARCRVQIITSGTGGTVQVPSVQKNYFVQNKASGDVVFTTGAGTTATVLPGSDSVTQIICDGTNVFIAQPLRTSLTPTHAYHLTNKTYVDGAIITASLGSNIPAQAGKTGPLFTNGTTADFRQIETSDVDGLDAILANLEAQVQEFTASGSCTIDAAAAMVLVEAYGAGAGGGSGRRGAAGTARGGGGGGGGGAYLRQFYTPSELTSPVTVTIGAGGAGGAAVAVNTTDGNVGTSGGNTTFGAYLTAPGGSGGQGGPDSAGGAGGTGGSLVSGAGGFAGGASGSGSGYGGGGGGPGSASTTGAAGGGSAFGGGGGGGGGGVTTGNANTDGGAGGARSLLAGAAGGVGAVGAAGTSYKAGGGGAATFAGGAGGMTGGGGGGGASLNGTASGAGGGGGSGFVRVTTWRN